MLNKTVKFLLLSSIIIYVNAVEYNQKNVIENSENDQQQSSKKQNKISATENRLFIHSTTDNKDNKINRRKLIESILKITDRYPQYVIKNQNEIYINHLINIGSSTRETGVSLQPQYQIIPDPYEEEICESAKPTIDDGNEVPFIPEDDFTSNYEPSNSAELDNVDEDYDYEGNDEADDDYGEEPLELEKMKSENVLNKELKKLEKLKQLWLQRYEVLLITELEFRRQLTDFHHRQNLLSRRDAINKQAEKDMDHLLRFRRKRRREDINKKLES